MKIDILDAIIEDVDRLELCLDVSICDCGEPYRESDAYDYCTELKNNLKQAREELSSL